MNWPTRTVADLQAEGVLLVEDGNHGEYRPRPHEFVQDGTRFIRATDISNGRVRFESASCINDVARARIRKGVGQPLDILFSHKGTVGKIAFVPTEAPPFVCSPQTTFWRVLDEHAIDRRYLHAYLRSPLFTKQWYVRKGETDMADYVSLTAQRSFGIALPPHGTQRKIAAVLAAYDELIENNLRRIEILEEMAQAAYREWFVNFRFPGHENVALVDSSLGPIPEGWQIVRIRDVASVNSESIRPKDVPCEIQYIDISSVSPGSIDAITIVRFEEAPSRARRVVRHGDTIWSTVRPNRRSFALVLNPTENTIVSTGFAVLRPRTVPWAFLYLATSTMEFSAYLANHARGAAYPAVNAEDFENARLVIPPGRLLEHFAPLVEPMFELRESLRKQDINLRVTRDLLLPKLISGEIDVSELDIDTEWLAS
ncbi:MAG: restriction endonuclease subunit S [Acidimicrobiia bacterium]|nr:restriction endonuclease subunit S [Acidimicrobiia bacterium]